MNETHEEHDTNESERLRGVARCAADIDAVALRRAHELHRGVRTHASVISRQSETLAAQLNQRSTALAGYVARPQRQLDQTRVEAAAAIAGRKREIARLTWRLWWRRNSRRVFWTVVVATLVAAIWLYWDDVLTVLDWVLSRLRQTFRRWMAGY